MEETNVSTGSMTEEVVLNEAIEETVDYPSATLLLQSCIEDYQRLQDSYNRIYEKTNIALAFVGVVLTVMISSCDFSLLMQNTQDMLIGEIIKVSFEMICLVGSMLALVFSAIYLLILLKGRKIAVFKSEDIRKEEIYRNKESHAAVWLIEKYTTIVNEIRPIVQKKQKSFDKALIVIIVGVILYAVSIMFSKGVL